MNSILSAACISNNIWYRCKITTEPRPVKTQFEALQCFAGRKEKRCIPANSLDQSSSYHSNQVKGSEYINNKIIKKQQFLARDVYV